MIFLSGTAKATTKLTLFSLLVASSNLEKFITTDIATIHSISLLVAVAVAVARVALNFLPTTTVYFSILVNISLSYNVFILAS